MTTDRPAPDSVLLRRQRVESTLDLIAAIGPSEAAELPLAQDALCALWPALEAKQEGADPALLVAAYRRARGRLRGALFCEALDLLAQEVEP